MNNRDSNIQQQDAGLKSRKTLTKFLIIVLPMWMSAKFYNGPYSDFVNTYLAGLIAIILISILVQLVFTSAQEKSVLVALFILLSSVQIAALIFPSPFSQVTLSFANTILIGGKYTVNMIPYYGVGGFIGFFVLKSCRTI